MKDAWCKRLVMIIGVWAVLALVLQTVISLGLH